MAKKEKLRRHPKEEDVKENLQDAPEDVKADCEQSATDGTDEVSAEDTFIANNQEEFLQGETDELPEGAEEISNEKAAELEKQAKKADKCLYFDGKKINRECKKDDCKCYLLSSLDCDDFTEVSEEEKERVNESDPNDTSSNEEEKQKVEEEVKSEPVEEQKKYLKQKENYLNDIKELEEKNVVLEKEADKFENLASTINFEPFNELKDLVKDAIKIYTDRDDLKELKKKIKNFDAINQMENLLNEYKQLAEDNRANITANNNDIKTFKEKIEDLESKIKHFQTKLSL